MLMHLQGQYIAEAILATVGNMFSSKSAKLHKYPKKPYEIFGKEKIELTEEEKQRQVDLFFAQEKARRSNWKRKHKDS